MKESITIKISKFLTNDYVAQIARNQWRSEAPEWINRSRVYVFDELINDNDCFGVVAVDSNDEVIGRMHCVKNENNPKLWYYGDLFVVERYRRKSIATRMIKTAVEHLSEMGASELICYVEPENANSRAFQTSAGFVEKPFVPFNDFLNDGQIMYSLSIPTPYSVIPATLNEAYFVRVLFVLNKSAMKSEDISYSKWQELLSSSDGDEKHFLICKGALPVAYMNINGFENKDNSWLSMLFVAPKFHRQGIGEFAVKYAEKYVADNGFRKLNIQTTSDNIPAQNLYRKCGYLVVDSSDKVIYTKSFIDSQAEVRTELKYMQLYKDNHNLCAIAQELWVDFIKEVNGNDGKKQTKEQILDGFYKRVSIQGSRNNMHFEVMFLNRNPIGIAMFAIDLGTVYGLLEKGYGTVMGFYIHPKYRKMGYGRAFWEHIESVLRSDGASKFYICPDSVTGVPFWTSIGFEDSHLMDPDDKKAIFLKR